MAAATNTTRGSVKLAGDIGGGADADNPQLPTSGATAGAYTNPNVTVNAKGITTYISSGSAVDVFNVALATTVSKGVIQVGQGFSIVSGLLSINLATTTVPGIVQIGTGVNVTGGGVISLDSYTVPMIASGYQYSGSIATAIKTLTGVTGSTTLDFSQSNVFSLSLTGNITLNTPSNLLTGGTYFIVLRQDATGSRTLTTSSAFKFESGSSTALTTTGSAIDVLRVTVMSSTELVCRLLKNFV